MKKIFCQISMVSFLLALGLLWSCTSSFAYNISEDIMINGYIENYSAVRLFDHSQNELEDGDLAQMRTTIFLDGQWNFSENFKFKAIGRAVYDGAYDINDHDYSHGYDPADEDYWPGPDELGMREYFDPREYYVNYHTRDFSLTAGRQQVVWGEADNLRMADMVNPLDLSWDWSFPAWEDIRVPLHLVRARYNVPHSKHHLEFEVVWNPYDFRPQQTAPFGANWQPLGMATNPIQYEVFRDQVEEDLPDRSMSDTGEIGGRIKAHFGPLATSWFAFYHRNDQTAGLPIFTFNPQDALDPANLPFEFKWPYKTTLGGTFNYYQAALKTVFRGEFSYDIDQPFGYLIDFTPNSDFLSGEYEEKDKFSFMLGFDRNTWIRFLNDYKTFYFSGQWFQSFVLDADEGELTTGYGDEGDDTSQTVFSLLVNTEYMFGKIKPEVVAVHSLTEECGFVDYSVEYQPTFTWSFTLGARNIWGNNDNVGIWGPVRENDQIYIKVKKTF